MQTIRTVTFAKNGERMLCHITIPPDFIIPLGVTKENNKILITVEDDKLVIERSELK